MVSIAIHNRINQIITQYYRLKIWHGEGTTSSLLNGAAKASYFVIHLSYLIAVFAGLFLCDDNELIFQTAVVMASSVINVKFFVDFVTTFLVLASCGTVPFFCFHLPIFTDEIKLPLAIGFPLNWRINQWSYWTAYVFIVLNHVLTVWLMSSSVIIWYIMINCSIKYELLGSEFRRIGTAMMDGQYFEAEKKNIFLREFIDLIRKYQELRKNISHFGSFFHNIFFIQIISSGLTICCSVYAQVSTDGDNIVLSSTYLAGVLYNMFDIYMIAYFGNEIELASSRLSYCIFESNWTGQSESFKSSFVVLAEVLRRPQRLIICKLYPLNLATFTSILNLSYRMFNILLKLKFSK